MDRLPVQPIAISAFIIGAILGSLLMSAWSNSNSLIPIVCAGLVTGSFCDLIAGLIAWRL